MTSLGISNGSDFSGFDSFNTKGNQTLERASNTLKRLSQEIISNNGPLDEPMIVGIHGKPGLGKTHLIRAFERSITGVTGINILRPNRRYGFSQMQNAYRAANVIIFDDLFQEHQTFDNVFEEDKFTKQIKDPEVCGLPEFIFDLYDGKKLWVVSSNFDIREILRRIENMDQQERLSSRVNHLLASTGVLHLEGEDHRVVLAKTGTRFSKLFD